MKMQHKAALIASVLLLYSASAAAQLSNQGLFDQVVTEFATRATAWRSVVMNAALWLFWTLGTISLVWTGGMLILRKADIGEFFAEFFRFIMFFGFFLWLLRNGPAFASSIIQSLQRLGEQASGISSVTPSGIVDIGFMIFKQALTNMSLWSPIDSLIGFVLSLAILLLLATVGVNMLLLFVSSWILMYAGVFFLGFGGSRWTSDMAINYYKTVLGVAVQIFAMVLLVGIGVDLLSAFYAKMNKGTLNFEELGVMVVFCFALLMLINKIPALLSGVITGASIGHAGIGNFGAGAAIGAAGVAAAAAATGGAMIAAGAANAAGGAQAVMAAFSKANDNVQSGSDVLTSMWSGGGGGGNDSGSSAGGSSSDSGGSSPFAQAAGFGGTGSPSASHSAKSDEKSESVETKSNGSNTDQTKSQGGDSKQASTSGGAGQGSSSASGQSTPASSGGFLAAAANAGKIAADAGANLAAGATAVAKEKATSMMESAKERISDTTGGKIAAAIKSMGTPDTPIFNEENSLSGSQSEQADPKSEVAAFARRDHDHDSKSA